MDERPAIELLLSPFRVLDITEEKGCYFCAKILGDLGAEVIRIEKPEVPKDFWWWAYNDRKKLVSLDIEKEPDRLLQLVREVDFLIESFPPGYLDRLGLGYATLRRLNPGLVMTSITPFGQTGPYKDLKASDLEILAMAGVLHGMGDPDRPPVRISLPQSYLLTSAEAAVGTLIALHWRELTGEGQQVDVSAQECVLGVLSGGIGKQEIVGIARERMGRFHGSLPGTKLGGGQVKYNHPQHPLLWPCKDGHVAFLMLPGTRGAYNNRALVKYMEMDGDLPDIVRNIKWESFDITQTSPEDLSQIWGAFARLFARHTHQEIYQIAQKERIELFPGNTVKDSLTEEQLEARRFWQEHKIPEFGKTFKLPGSFAQAHFPASGEVETMPEEKPEQPRLPFEGIKVLEFTLTYTGPRICQWLAMYGAEVIKVESSSHLDTYRRSPGYGFVSGNASKKGITLNLKHPRGRELAYRLASWADVVIENFTPGTVQKLGLGYEELLKINPRIVMFSASMLGSDGPHAAQPGLGHELTSLSGFNDLTGWPDRPPATAGPYTDIIAIRMGSVIASAVLDYQRRTGKGCYIDLSQFEASLHFLAPLILEYQATGNLLSRMGNRSLTDCPHGVFPCQGHDRWCAISVTTDSEWQVFCRVMGQPEWAREPRFATIEARKANEDELENRIAQWSRQFSPDEVVTQLREVGLRVGMVADSEDILKDPQLHHRDHFIAVKHPEAGEYYHSAPGFRLEKAVPVVQPAPALGEHNRYVCTQILGLSDEEFSTCLGSGVFE